MKSLDNTIALRNFLSLLTVAMVAIIFGSCADDTLDKKHDPSDLMQFCVADRITRCPVEAASASSLSVLTSADAKDTLYMYSHLTDIASTLKPQTRGELEGDLGNFLLSCAIEKSNEVYGYYFQNELYSKLGVNLDDKEYYWTNTGTQDFRFYGVAPANMKGVSGGYSLSFPENSDPSLNNTPVISYTVPTNAAAQLDLKAVTTPKYADTAKQTVPLGFKHLMTAIRFSADESVFPGKILSIKFENVYSHGEYHMYDQDEQDSPVWTAQSVPADYELTGLNTTVNPTSTEITPAGEASFFLMPQVLPEGARVTVRYKNGVTNTEYDLEADIAGMNWIGGKVVNFVISTAGITATQRGLHLVAKADPNVLPATVKLTHLGDDNADLLTTPVSLPAGTTTFNLMPDNFIDNMVAGVNGSGPLTGKQYYKVTLTKDDDPTMTQELVAEYTFDYMAFTVDMPANNLTLKMPFVEGNQTPGATPSTLMFRWQPGDYTDEFTLVTDELSRKTYNTPGEREVRVYSNLTGDSAIPALGNTTVTPHFPVQTKTVETKLLNCSNTSVALLFMGCANLERVPATLFDDNAQITVLNQTFQDCSSLASIPAGLFDKLTLAYNFNGTFRACTALTAIPAGLFDNCAAGYTFDSVFQGCERIAVIPSALFANCNKAYNFQSAFHRNLALETIPGDMFKNCTQAANFANVFNGCDHLTAIPQGLFDDCSAATNFNAAFLSCTALTAIPDGLFDNCTKAAQFGETFSATAITSVNYLLFDQCPLAVNFSGVFNGCKFLETIPTGLFRNNPNALYFQNAFKSCDRLQSIPDGLFANCGAAQNFTSVFQDCKSLTSIPAHLFDNCEAAIYMQNAFFGCSEITGPIPATLFVDCKSVQNFTMTFKNCSKITEIPAGLFTNCTAAQNFNQTFAGCNGINQPLPAGLFKNLSNATTFTHTFWGCGNLPGPIPSDLLEGCSSAKDLKFLFYQCGQLNGTIPAGFFDDCNKSAITNLSTTFCQTALSGPIPTGLLSGMTNLQDVTSLFMSTSLSGNLPPNLFEDCGELKNVTNCFCHDGGFTGPIPDDFFAYNPKLESVNTTFYGCGGLTKVPLGLFRNCHNITDFYQTFCNCIGLTGAVPELWDNDDFKNLPSAKTAKCFQGISTSVTNYSDIPTTWGGPATPSSRPRR